MTAPRRTTVEVGGLTSAPQKAVVLDYIAECALGGGEGAGLQQISARFGGAAGGPAGHGAVTAAGCLGGVAVEPVEQTLGAGWALLVDLATTAGFGRDDLQDLGRAIDDVLP